MKKIKFMFLFLFCLLTINSCATAPKVEQLCEFQPTDKKIIMLSNGLYLRKLRVALKKKGFDVPKYSYTQSMLSKTTKDEGKETTETFFYNKTEYRYGVEVVDFEVVDFDLFSSNKKINITLEIIDISTNEVVAYVTNGGWDRKDKLYESLAQQIYNIWHRRYKAIEEDVENEELEEEDDEKQKLEDDEVYEKKQKINSNTNTNKNKKNIAVNRRYITH